MQTMIMQNHTLVRLWKLLGTERDRARCLKALSGTAGMQRYKYYRPSFCVFDSGEMQHHSSSAAGESGWQNILPKKMNF